MRKVGKTFRIISALLYSACLGLAISLTMDLHYAGIYGDANVNYLRMNASVLLRGLGFSAVILVLLLGMLRWQDKMAPHRLSGRITKVGWRFFAAWMGLIICWLPYLLTFYPGGIVGDGAEALEYALDASRPIDGRWGTAYVLLLRGFVALGRVFTQDIQFGVFLYAAFSMMLYAGACAAVVCWLWRRGMPPATVILCEALYAVCGHYASYSICLWKDGLFGAGVVVFSLLMWEEMEARSPRQASKSMGLGMTALFLCLWRNFIGWAMLLAGGILALLLPKSRKKTAVLLLAMALLSLVIQGPVYRAIGVTNTPAAESLAIPIQQTAAVIQSGQELTAAQEELLYTLLPREEWIRLYRPAVSDTIKVAINNEALEARLPEFLRTWGELLIRHPVICVKAHLMETLGFWQPYGSNQGFYHDWFVGVQDIYGRGFASQDLILNATGTTLEPGLMSRLSFLPSGMIAWVMLFSLVVIVNQRRQTRKRLLIMMPYLVCWAGVMLTAPIAYSYRYVEMLAMGLPLFLVLPFIQEEVGEDRSAEHSMIGRAGSFASILESRRVSLMIAVMILLGLLTQMITGSLRVGGFQNGQMIIWTCGEQDNAKYYITEGLSVNEGTFAWTEGDQLTVRFPWRQKETEADVTIEVLDTFNGSQRYEIIEKNGKTIATGTIDGPGQIRFKLSNLRDEAAFSLKLPDAIWISEVLGVAGDERKIALQINHILFQISSD